MLRLEQRERIRRKVRKQQPNTGWRSSDVSFGNPEFVNPQSELLKRKYGFIIDNQPDDRDMYLMEQEMKRVNKLKEQQEAEIQLANDQQMILDEIAAGVRKVSDTVLIKPSNDPVRPVRVELTPELKKRAEQEDALRALEEQSKRLKLT